MPEVKLPDHVRIAMPVQGSPGIWSLVCFRNALRGIDRRDTYRKRCDEHPALVGKKYEKPWFEVCDEQDCCTDHDKERRRLAEMFRLGQIDARWKDATFMYGSRR